MKQTDKLPSFVLPVLVKDKATQGCFNLYKLISTTSHPSVCCKHDVAPFPMTRASHSLREAISRLILLKKVGSMLYKTLFRCYLGGCLRYCPLCCHAEKVSWTKPTRTRCLARTRVQPCASLLALPHILLPSKPLREPPERLVIWYMLISRAGGEKKITIRHDNSIGAIRVRLH